MCADLPNLTAGGPPPRIPPAVGAKSRVSTHVIYVIHALHTTRKS